MIHKLKIWPQYYEPVRAGSKTFEYRLNDRNFQNGDTVELHEWNPDHPNMLGGGYTGRTITFDVGYVLPVSETHVVFSLLEIKK